MSKNFRPSDAKFAREAIVISEMGDRSPSTLGAGPLCGGRWEMGSLEGVRLKVEGGNGLGMGGDS